MKKLHVAIVCIFLVLFISCDEKKAKDEIKKALDKTVEETDKATPKGSGTLTNTKGEDAGGEGVEEPGKTPPPPLTPPALSSYREKVGTPITFPKVEGYSYKLKDPTVSGVILSDATSDATKKQVSSTKIVSGIFVVATKDGKSIESESIEFFMELTKPALSSEREAWSTLIAFPKVLGHTYELKEEKTGVTLNKNPINSIQVIATQSAQNVIIVATFDGRTIESNPIEFTRIPGNTLSFAQASRTQKWKRTTVTFTQTATKSGGVAGDTRDIKYSGFAKEFASASVIGFTVNRDTGKVTATGAPKTTYTITAELPQTEKYTRATASYTFVIE